MKYIKKGVKIYKVNEEVNKTSELALINKQLGEIDAQEKNKIDNIQSSFQLKRDELNVKKTELNKLI